MIPLAILVVSVFTYKVNIPYWDQWSFVPYIEKSFEEGITLKDLWSQHNEHRLIFPKMVMFILARLSHYDITYELIFILLLAVATVAVLDRQSVKIKKEFKWPGLNWILPIISILIFSLDQEYNWVWGWQLQIFLNLLAVVGGLSLLNDPRLSWRKYILALGLGIVATYSFANGLLYWGLGLLPLWCLKQSRLKKRIWMLSVWIVTSLGMAFSYFHDFQTLSGKPLGYVLKHIFEYGLYVLKFIGAKLINYETYAVVFGMIGLVLFIWMTLYFLKKGPEDFRRILPFVLLGLYTLGTALLSGIGRLELGSGTAMSGRYKTFSSLIWVADFVFLYYLFFEISRRFKKFLRFAGLGFLSIFVLVFLFISLRSSYRVGHRGLRSFHANILEIKNDILQNKSGVDLSRLFPHTNVVQEGLAILEKYHLSIYR